MELKDFVSQTLTQIIQGVSEAKGSVTGGAQVAPLIDGLESDLYKHGMLNAQGQAAHLVKFDVALTVIEGSETKGGVGVFAGAVALGSSGQSENQNTSVSRVQFGVPVILPSGG